MASTHPLTHTSTATITSWLETGRRALARHGPTLLNMTALLLLTASLAQWTWTLATPKVIVAAAPGAITPTETQTPKIEDALAANLFGTPAAESVPLAAAPPEHIPQSKLDLLLTGVVAAGAESLALIRVNTEPETPFALGDQITHGVTLQAVYADRAIILRRGVAEALLLEDKAAGLTEAMAPRVQQAPTGVVKTGDTNFRVDRDYVTRQMQNPDIFRQALIVPNPGGGFLVRQIQPGSIYERFGLKVGDIIRKVNGRSINTMDEVLRLYQQLGGVEQVIEVELEVVRAGKAAQLRYAVQ
jgi:general secretion pathway protein C